METICGEQRPDRVAIPPLFIQGTARVEVRLTLDCGVDRHEPSPPGEAVIVEDLDQLVEGSAAPSKGSSSIRAGWKEIRPSARGPASFRAATSSMAGFRSTASIRPTYSSNARE